MVGTAASGLQGDNQLKADVRNVTFRNSAALDTTFGCHVKYRFPQVSRPGAVAVALGPFPLTPSLAVPAALAEPPLQAGAAPLAGVLGLASGCTERRGAKRRRGEASGAKWRRRLEFG